MSKDRTSEIFWGILVINIVVLLMALPQLLFPGWTARRHASQLTLAAAAETETAAAFRLTPPDSVDFASNAVSAPETGGDPMAVEAIARLDGDPAVYQSTLTSPYDSSVLLEMYTTGARVYYVSTRTYHIVQIDAGSLPVEGGSAAKTVDELRLSAVVFIGSAAPGVDLSALTPVESEKGEVFFFRWEHPTDKLNDGLPAFITVGMRSDGQVVSYTNTLDF